MIQKIFTAITFCAALSFNSIAQNITNYTFSAYSGTFTALSGATTANLSSGTTDEGYVNNIPIGFDFWYMGTRYTTISASSNGWLAFGSAITNATPVNSLTSGGAPRPLIAPLWDNLDLSAATKISYVTTGSTGARIFAAQYLNVRWITGASAPVMSFQVKLYESTGKIEFIYRQEAGALNTPSASIGIAASSTGSGQFLSVSNTGATVSSTVEANITSKPITGNTYSFTSPIPTVPAGLTFSSISSSSMTLNWSDVSSNETGFVIYRSTDGVNYTFASQVSANTTSSVQSGLTPTTLYYWKIYSVTEGALSATSLNGNNSTTCVPPAPPVVTSPVNYCMGATAVALSATGSNLQWGGNASGVAGGTGALTATTTYVDNGSNNKRTKFTTTAANVKIISIDYSIPAWQSVVGVVISIYNSSGTIIATSTTNTTQIAGATPVIISNSFNYTLTTAGDYSIGISSGFGNIGADSPTFPLLESTGIVNVTGVTAPGARCFNNIQFATTGSSTAPVPSTATVGTTSYLVTQTVSGCTSSPATIVVNVTSANISQIPSSGLIGNYKFNANANDETANNNGTLQGSPTLTADRFNIANKAYAFNGSSQYVSTAKSYVNPTNFTVSIWFKTSTTTGGKLIGFGTSQTGSSGQYDRHLYMNNAGQIYFGIYSGVVFTVSSPQSYNDNQWHLATGTLSSTTGMALYIDGALVDSNTSATAAENYTGYWRIGYDNNNGWTSQPTSFFFNGILDDALIYSRALTPSEVSTIYVSPDGAGNNGPACVGSNVTLSATTVPGGTYSWTGPAGFSSSLQNPSFSYTTSNAGVYTLNVTVSGCTATAYTNLAGTTAAGQWTGNISTDWATAGNWCAGAVPTSSTNVTIPASAIRMPSINSSVTSNNLTVSPGATLTLTSTGILNIAGLLTNTGTINNTGTVNFNGTSGQQTFAGVSSFYNMTVTNASGVIIPAALTVANNVTLASGTLNSNSFNINVGGNWINNSSTAAFNASSATVSFNGSVPQSIGGSFSTTFNNLSIANAASTVSLATNISIAGDLSVVSGTFDLHAFTANRTSNGGTLTVANNATLKIGGTNTFPSNYATTNLVVASTVEYSGTNQAVSNQTYGNLSLTSSSGAAVKTLAGTPLTIVGNLSSSIGSGTSVTYTAAAPITISGSVNIGASTTFNAATFTHSIGGNWINNGTFNGNSSTTSFTGPGKTISGAGIQNFNNLNITAPSVGLPASVINVSGNLSTSGAGSILHAAGGTVVMTGAGASISGPGLILENLSITGSVSTAASLTLTGNLSVTGSFTTGAVLTMSGSSTTISGTGTKTFGSLFITGSVTTAVNSTITSNLVVNGTFSATGGTTTFTGTSTLSGRANLFDVNINGTSLQLSSNSTLGIAGALTITSGTLNVTSSIPNTVNFNGAGAQNINALTYYNLAMSNGNNKTAAGALTVNNNITIDVGTTFTGGSFTHSIYNDWINNGTFVPGSGTIQFLTVDESYITGNTTFNILTVNAASPANDVFLQANVTASIVNMTNGILLTGANVLTITNTRTGNGKLRGTITRTHSFTTGVPYAFESPTNTITFTAVTGVTSITMNIKQSPVLDFPFGNSVNEEDDITISGVYVATLRYDYSQDDLNGNDENTMVLWHNTGASWASAGKTANDPTSDYVELAGITNLNGRWTLSGSINTVTWNGSTSSDWNTASNWTVVQGAPSRPPSSTDVVQLGFTSFVNNPVITSSAAAKNIRFGSAQAVTLTLNAGGSLQVSGNVDGDWTGNAVHNINVNGQTVTITENLDLSDDVAGQSINLNIGSGNVNILGSLFLSGDASVAFSGTGTLRVFGHFQHDGGTFSKGNGTVIYNGTDNQDVADLAYNNLVIDKPSQSAFIASNVSASGNLTILQGTLINKGITTVGGNVTISSGATLENDNILHVGGDWINSGTFQGEGVSVIFDGTGSQSISATTFNNLIFNKPVGSTAQLTGNIIIKGNVTISSGTVDIQTFTCNRSTPGGVATLANNGTFVVGGNTPLINFSDYVVGSSSTLILNGTITQTLNFPNVAFGNVIFRNSGPKILATPAAINGDLTIESGTTFNAGANTITLNGNWINNGTFIPSSSTLIWGGTSKQISGNTTFNQVTVYGSYTILNNVTFNGLLNITSAASLSGGSSISTTLNGDLINSGILYTLGTTTFTGLVQQTLSLINSVQTVAVTVNFNGSVPPVLHSSSTPQFGFLNVNNTGGVNPSVDWEILYALSVGSGASFNAGSTTQNIYGSLSNNGVITTSGFFNLLPTSTATANFGSNFSSSGTLQLGGAGAFTISGTPSSLKNVLITNSNAAGISPPSDWTLLGNLNISAGSILNAGAHNYAVAGDIINAGVLNSGTSTFIVNGASLQNINNPSGFNNLTTNKSSGQTVLLSNTTVNGAMTFIGGVIKTGTNTLILPASGTVSGAAQGTGWISGYLQKNIATGTPTRTFEIGDDTYFTPVTLAFTNVTSAGNMTMNTTYGNHPSLESSSINPARNVNRYWTLVNNGVAFSSYNATFNFVASDVDAGANTSAFKVKLFDGTSWISLAVASPNALSIQATGVTGTGDFAIGEICNATTTISYADTPYCSNEGTVAVTLSGSTGGIFTAPSSLAVNASTGAIDLGASQGGDYVVTYSVNAAGGCPAFYTTSNITVTTAPNATISYPSTPYCSSAEVAAATLIGTPGGAFTSSAGLIINPGSGLVDLKASDAGSYTVTYTVPASGGCSQFSTTNTIAITTQPSATGTYEGNPYCSNEGIAFPTGSATGAAGSFSSAAGLIIDPVTGEIDLAASTAGTYTVTYTVPASGGCSQYSNTATVAITALPSASISYTGSPFCSTVSAVPVVFSGTTGGVYSSSVGLALNGSTGVISPVASSGGNYTITYTMAARNGCSEQTATTDVTITEMPNATISYVDSPYLAGQGTVQVLLSGVTGTGGTYSSAPELDLDATTGAINTDDSGSGTFTVTYAVPAGGGCAPYTTNTNVTIYFNLKVWDGGAGTILWGDAANWDTDGVPTQWDDIALTGAGTITINVNATSHDLKIDNPSLNINVGAGNALNVSGDLNIVSGNVIGQGQITLSGDWVNNGSFNSNTSTVEFNGVLPQSISGTSVTDFYNVFITNNSAQGVSVESKQNIHGILTLADNTILDADGAANNAILTIVSAGDNPSQDAAVGILPSGAHINGKVTVERFMTKEGWNNSRIYRYISSPIASATVADLQGEIPVSGTFSGSSACANCGTNPSMYYYNEPTTADSDGNGIQDFNDGYISFPTASNQETMTPGKGYAIFVRGNILPSTSWNVRGQINTGITPASLPVTYTSSGNAANDGWNLVGNPFPSTIDWNSSSGWTKTNIDGAIYITDNGSGSSTMYATWNGTTGTNGGSRYIATGQGFWVKASDTPVLSASENVKAPGSQTTFFREGTITNLLRITLKQNNVRDEAVIHFRDDATNGFDANADAWKLRNKTFNISSLSEDGKDLAINSWSKLVCAASIKLNVTDVTPGVYVLAFTNLDSFSPNFHIVLKDQFTNKETSLVNGTSYEFEVTSSPLSFGKDRFVIEVQSDAKAIEIQETAGILSVAQAGAIKWFYNDTLIPGVSEQKITVHDPGTYRIEVDNDGCKYTGTYEYTVTGLENAGAEELIVYPNPATTEIYIEVKDAAIDTMVLTSIVGKTIDDIRSSSTNSGKTRRLELSGIASGIYFLYVKSNGRTYVRKVIKQ